MKRFLLVVLLLPMFGFSQRKKNKPIIDEVFFSVEPNVRMMKAFGNNFMNKSLSPFVGFGIAGNMELYKGFGLGLEYNRMSASVKIEDSLFGNLGGPEMNNFEFYAFYKHPISEDFFVEGLGGLSIYRISSSFLDHSGKFNEGNNGFHLGGKAIYNLDMQGVQQVVVGLKLNYYTSSIRNQDIDIQNYFNKAWLANVNLAYRINF